MKKLMIMLTLTTSLASFSASALEAIAGTYLVGTAAMASLGVTSSVKGLDCTLGQGACKEATQVLADTQDYLQSGELSAFLAEKIKFIQVEDKSVSEQEALDALNAASLKILN
jgi:hypothetical protein